MKAEPYSQYQPTKAEAKKPSVQRLMAAEDVCWALITMMALGGLDIPKASRAYLVKEMDPWLELATKTGVLPK